MFFILERSISQGDHIEMALDKEYESHEEALKDAKGMLAGSATQVYLVVQALDEVRMAPTVTSFAPPPPPGPVYRGGLDSHVALEPEAEGPPRVPQVRPRLLIVDRKATPAELVGYLMVVAEGRIVKNAFGSLDVQDMPLSSAEATEVDAAMRPR